MSISIKYYRFNKADKKLVIEKHDFKETDKNTLFIDDSIKMIYNKIIDNLYNDRNPIDKTQLYCWYISKGKPVALGFMYPDNIKMGQPVKDINIDTQFIDMDGNQEIQTIDDTMNKTLLNCDNFKNVISVIDIYEMLEYLRQNKISVDKKMENGFIKKLPITLATPAVAKSSACRTIRLTFALRTCPLSMVFDISLSYDVLCPVPSLPFVCQYHVSASSRILAHISFIKYGTCN